MAWFSKRQKSLLPATVLSLLPSYGAAALEARRVSGPVTDPRFGWEFVGAVHMAMFNGDKSAIIGELYAAARASQEPELATFGAYRLIAEFDAELDDPRYLEMLDASIALMRASGFSGMHLTGIEHRRAVS